jgi:hypothetical protein
VIPLLLLLQAAPLEVSATVDRSRIAVGEHVTLTVRAVSRSTAAFRADLPSYDGFALVEQRERTDVVPSGREVARAYTLELELRAEQVGTWTIGSVRVEQGTSSAFTTAATVVVTNASGGGAVGLESDLLAVIGRVPLPRYGGPSVFIVPSAEQLYAGDQLNVLTAAWLPRGLRLRLRQPPTLSPPALPGVWSTPRTSVPGAVASRSLEGELYDLFVGFQTVYPLNPGVLAIPRARLSWTEPGNRQFSSEDRRRSAESGISTVVVRPLPDAGRPADFQGPVARGLRIEYRLSQGAGRAGAVLPVDIVLSGAGNLPLWPAPQVAWPGTARVYEEGSESAPRLSGQRIAGTRKFRYAVVPDSAGSLPLPPIEYAYFDPGDGTYKVSRAAGIVVPVLEAPPLSERRSPLPIWIPGRPTFVEQVFGLPAPLLALLYALPVALLAGLLLLRRRRPRALPASAPGDPALELEQMFVRLALSPPSAAAPIERSLTGALRKAGFPREQAEHLVRLHRELEAERFGGGAGGATPALVRDIEEALRDIPKRLRRSAGLAALLAGMLLTGALPNRLAAQPGLTLYGRGEYAAAAQAFRNEPPSPARWYDVAVSEYMARRDPHAVAALIGARAGAPRDDRVKALWTALSREHEQLRRSEPAWPVTARELFFLALVLLWVGALLAVLLRRRPLPAAVAVLLAAVAAGTGGVLRSQQSIPRAVLAGGASLRLSPHGLAPERGAVPAFTVVRLDRRLGTWWLVETREGARGWVPEEILAHTPR